MIIHGTHTQSYTTAPALVSLALAKAHLKISNTSEDTLIQSYIDAATQWCEMYIQRSLCVSQITMYYHPDSYRDGNTDTGDTADFILMYPADCNKSIEITSTDSDGDVEYYTDYTVLKGAYDTIRVRDLVPYEMLEICYTTRKYEHADRVVPAILMKIGEMYTLRADGEIPKQSAIINILNRHRVKKHI